MRNTAADLRQLLHRFASESTPPAAAFTTVLRDALLHHGSHPTDNLSAAERIEVGPINDCGVPGMIGLRLVNNHDSASSVLNVLEGTPIPPQVAEMMPPSSTRGLQCRPSHRHPLPHRL